MLTITPCLEKDIVVEYCRKSRRAYSTAHYVYRAENRGQVLAACLFEVGGDQVEPLLYEAEDAEDVFLFDGVLRAGLNYAAEQGVENGLLSEEFRAKHGNCFARLNYPAQPRFNITNFFQKYKNCGGAL